ncbi:MAG: WD40 repeat domain-containing protein [Anaerolineae bacterium]|nr:WD40 repeat domain-containing protein [Anaerolineae bacterium]
MPEESKTHTGLALLFGALALAAALMLTLAVVWMFVGRADASLEPEPRRAGALSPEVATVAAGTAGPGEPTVTPSEGAKGTGDAFALDSLVELERRGKGTVRDLVYAPDGREAAVVASLGVYFYQPDTLDLLRRFEAPSAYDSAAFAPDWSLVAWVEGRQVQLLDMRNGDVVRVLDVGEGRPASPSFSPDSRLVAAVVFAPGEEVYTGDIVLWRVADGEVVDRWDAGAAALAFAPDGTLVSWYAMSGIHLWAVPGGESLGAVEVWPADIAFSTDGDVMAVSGMGEVRLWRTSDWSFLKSIPINSDELGQVAISPDGTCVAAATANGIRLWQVTGNGPPATLDAEPDEPVRALAFSPDGEVLACAQRALSFVRVSDGEVLRAVAGFLPPVRSVVASPAGSAVAAVVDLLDMWGSTAASVYVWHVDDADWQQLPAAGPALSVAYAPDGALLAAGGWDGRVRLVDLASGELASTIEAHEKQVQSVAFAPDGQSLASSSMGEVRVWHAEDGALVHVLAPPDAGWIERVAFSPDGSLLAALWNGRVWLWRTTDWTLAHALVTEDDGYPGQIVFAPDGSTVALARQGQVRLWRLPNAEFLHVLDLGAPGEGAVVYTPDGSLLAAGAGSEIEVWRVAGGDRLYTLDGHRSTVNSVSFLPDGQRFVSASQDGTVRLWGPGE